MTDKRVSTKTKKKQRRPTLAVIVVALAAENVDVLADEFKFATNSVETLVETGSTRMVQLWRLGGDVDWLGYRNWNWLRRSRRL